MAKMTEEKKAEVQQQKKETQQEKRSFHELLKKAKERNALIEYSLPAGELIDFKELKKS